MNWETVIGLEVHVQVNTNTKAFCGCSTAFGAEPNTQTCPVCLGMPGQLPVLNMEVARKSVLTGLAINATINLESKFDRKNYFYPDLPKGYQISQFPLPIVEHGYLDIPVADGEKRIGITRIHIEEDAGKSMHEGLDGVSHIDLNRSGVPLMEIVSEPDMRSADEAVAYLKQLHQLVRFLDVSGADMEKGQFRCDANVSVRRFGEALGTRAELKNLNSFRFIKQAIDYEVARQIELIEDGGQVVQETRLFDSAKGESRSMRSKEEAHDYRYFPEPDLPPLRISQEEVDGIRAGMPELPGQLRERFESEFGLSSYDADVLSQTLDLAGWYESLVAAHPSDPKRCANWMANELLGRLKEQGKDIADSPVSAQDLAGLLDRIADNTISGKIAKDVLDAMMATGESADAVIESKGLKQVSDSGAIDTLILQIMADNPGQLEQFRAGKDKLFGFFVGQVMKASKGQANPGMVNQRLQDLLKG
ncbi:MAG: Asp-tRNA(Asn)/Glu-tRNA(Gln) amidotransferase GatCAB subunit B [Zetaproteobacteria bacterium CG12_big_fil_rev_8_21_14_0_65_55_1124]|nr:MAG: aspartyl/glutamyl-tRNA amidotransferase subunit B [Zetaproteobacteria bacterium CG1_02_55_237]PIS19928.1 MAG: Asp-tRNA(Asn)/Glu-tRNA(Gln) amidotransferase GatCAB subunit B [Zetaproteobacteria bacterium CG08_land_8_20_14_0_20_55_17]PIW43649.1 MAG: Asp-tRNA(Asn)/Glu-tRNA(Gln) amidotransferase GatCAB subunit B [Zetaproteobacteria bacterium CG12_big_fil_rev_8_21_14_0_65_55_1124]PIY52682.1 MAG: Asp-tRNA(Asn)/Glu-tRNA(Gln) amidotransferase GatCAB subunit B [Zetaproteobacteria bacterium CG_4_10